MVGQSNQMPGSGYASVKLEILEQLLHTHMYGCQKQPQGPYYKETLIYVPLEVIPYSTYLISALYEYQS